LLAHGRTRDLSDDKSLRALQQSTFIANIIIIAVVLFGPADITHTCAKSVLIKRLCALHARFGILRHTIAHFTLLGLLSVNSINIFDAIFNIKILLLRDYG